MIFFLDYWTMMNIFNLYDFFLFIIVVVVKSAKKKYIYQGDPSHPARQPIL